MGIHMGNSSLPTIFPYISMALGRTVPASDSVCEGSNPSPAAKTQKALILLKNSVISRLFSFSGNLKSGFFRRSKVVKSGHLRHGESMGKAFFMGKIWGKYGERELTSNRSQLPFFSFLRYVRPAAGYPRGTPPYTADCILCAFRGGRHHNASGIIAAFLDALDSIGAFSPALFRRRTHSLSSSPSSSTSSNHSNSVTFGDRYEQNSRVCSIASSLRQPTISTKPSLFGSGGAPCSIM